MNPFCFDFNSVIKKFDVKVPSDVDFYITKRQQSGTQRAV